jgi:hypothetical protein
MLVSVGLYGLLGLLLLMFTVRTAEALGTRIAYTRVSSPADCIAKRTTTLAECAIKAERCLSRYDIPMSYFRSPCSAKSALTGCQCANRCNRTFVCFVRKNTDNKHSAAWTVPYEQHCVAHDRLPHDELAKPSPNSISNCLLRPSRQ